MDTANCTMPALPTQDNIEYRHVPDFPGYCVGNDGTVWSCWKRGSRSQLFFVDYWRKMRSVVQQSGHCHVKLRQNGRSLTQLVHRLVLFAFRGPPPEGHECCHFDGNPANNTLNNLRWGTHRENGKDMIRHGTNPSGEKYGASKLTWDAVREIRRIGASCSQRKLAARYGVGKSTIKDVLCGVTWTDTKDDIPNYVPCLK